MSVPTLAEILAQVRAEADVRLRSTDRAALRRSAAAIERRPVRCALERHCFAIVAEIKRASPSAGDIRPDLVPADLARSYQRGGAAALSVLTCAPWFRGTLADLTAARAATSLPVLCKDFLVTEFQVEEAAASGADVVLLIAAALPDLELAGLTRHARGLGLEVLHEVHDEQELERVVPLEPTLLGVNSRNLRTMTVDPDVPVRLGACLPAAALGIFESGVRQPEDVRRAAAAGYRAALVGESLLRAADPAAAIARLAGRESSR